MSYPPKAPIVVKSTAVRTKKPEAQVQLCSDLLPQPHRQRGTPVGQCGEEYASPGVVTMRVFLYSEQKTASLWGPPTGPCQSDIF